MSSVRVLRAQQLTSLRLFPLLLQQQECQNYTKRGIDKTCSTRTLATISEASQQQEGTGWMPSWLKTRMPEYASTLRQARRLGSVTNMIPGVSRASATDSLHLYESIISAMQPAEKQQLSSFDAKARHRVAEHVKCSVSQVDDCIAKYLYMKSMTTKVKQLKDEGDINLAGLEVPAAAVRTNADGDVINLEIDISVLDSIPEGAIKARKLLGPQYGFVPSRDAVPADLDMKKLLTLSEYKRRQAIS